MLPADETFVQPKKQKKQQKSFNELAFQQMCEIAESLQDYKLAPIKMKELTTMHNLLVFPGTVLWVVWIYIVSVLMRVYRIQLLYIIHQVYTTIDTVLQDGYILCKSSLHLTELVRWIIHLKKDKCTNIAHQSLVQQCMYILFADVMEGKPGKLSTVAQRGLALNILSSPVTAYNFIRTDAALARELPTLRHLWPLEKGATDMQTAISSVHCENCD